MQSMRHHRRPKALSQQAHDTEGNPEQSNQHHALGSLISMTEAEENTHHDQSDPAVAEQSRKLLLEIATEENFLAEARGGTEADPQEDFKPTVRRKKSNLLAGTFDTAGVVHAHGDGGHGNHQ